MRRMELAFRNEEEMNEEMQEEVQEKKATGMPEMDFMELLMREIESKTLNIMGNFDDNMVKYVRQFAGQLWYYEEDDTRPLFINITSHGGQACSLMAILDILESLKEEWGCRIIANVNGYAESCGAVLFCYADERYMNRFSEIMIHQISYGINSTLSDHVVELKRSQYIQDIIDGILCEKTPLTKKLLKKWYKEGDKFLNKKECEKLGLLTVENEKEENE